MKRILFVFKHNYTLSKCIWYEGIRDGLNRAYMNGEPKPLPLEDIGLLNEMCPHIATRKGLYDWLEYFIFLFFLNLIKISF